MRTTIVLLASLAVYLPIHIEAVKLDIQPDLQASYASIFTQAEIESIVGENVKTESFAESDRPYNLSLADADAERKRVEKP